MKRAVETETDEVAAKLVSANSELTNLKSKFDELEMQFSKIQEEKLRIQVELTDAVTTLKSSEEENRRRKSTADELREQLDVEVKTNKELQANLQRRSQELEETCNDLSHLQHTKKVHEGRISDVEAKLESTTGALSELQQTHLNTRSEKDRIALRVSTVESVEADLRAKLDQEVSGRIALQHQHFAESEIVVALTAKIDNFEHTMKVIYDCGSGLLGLMTS